MSREAADNPVVASVKSRLHTAAPVDVAVVSACRVIWIPMHHRRGVSVIAGGPTSPPG